MAVNQDYVGREYPASSVYEVGREKIREYAVAVKSAVVWLDPPDLVVMYQVTTRTARRVLGRRELWNGNRERLREVLSFDPHRSIIAWAWTTRGHNRAKYRAAMADPAFAHLRFVRLASRRDVARFLDSVL